MSTQDTQDTTRTQGPHEGGVIRERVLYPILIPLAAILFTEVIVFSFSRLYLTAGGLEAAVVALAIAMGILAGASAIAARPRIKSATITGVMVALTVVAVGSAGWAIQRGPYYELKDEPAADLLTLTVTSVNLDFDTELLELSSDGTTIEYINDDTQPHNIAIFPSADELGDPLFRGEIISGAERITYEIPSLDPGVYFFHCDVHPQMSGEAVVE